MCNLLERVLLIESLKPGTATVRNSDFRGLRKLRKLTGERFAAGVLLYDGETTVNWGNGMYAIPIRRLWETPLQPNQRA